VSLLNTITTGDARILSAQIPDESVDLIFTDPPYPKEFLPLYGWLSEIASRKLKPGGFLLAYAGNMYKYEVMCELSKHLTYFWDYIAMHAGMGTMVWPKNTVARHKSILAFAKGIGKPRCRTLGSWTGTGTDKRYHAWGQDESTSRYYTDCFTLPGELVLDPFCGGGTTAVVAKQLGRNFIGFEINPATADIARKRLQTVQPLLMPEEMEQLTLEVAG